VATNTKQPGASFCDPCKGSQYGCHDAELSGTTFEVRLSHLQHDAVRWPHVQLAARPTGHVPPRRLHRAERTLLPLRRSNLSVLTEHTMPFASLFRMWTYHRPIEVLPACCNTTCKTGAVPIELRPPRTCFQVRHRQGKCRSSPANTRVLLSSFPCQGHFGLDGRLSGAVEHGILGRTDGTHCNELLGGNSLLVRVGLASRPQGGLARYA
jgi:hypothetical protein